MNKVFICEYCGKECIKKGPYVKHVKYCKCNPNRTVREKKPLSQKQIEQYKKLSEERRGQKGYHKPSECQFCHKIYTNSGLRKIHENTCIMNPNRLPKRKGHPAWNKGKPAWNRGLTKETSESVRQGAERLSNRLRNGEVRNWHKHTEETKKKLSQIRLNSKVNYSMNVLPYLRKDGTYVNLDSGYERRLAKILDDEDIYWVRPKPIIWFDKKGIKHNYTSDFYLPRYNIYLDPKNEYCFKLQKEKIDYFTKTYLNVFFLHEKDLTKEKIKEIITKVLVIN